MKRPLVLASLALGSIAITGCASGGPEGAGERTGSALGELQTLVMARSAHLDMKGLKNYIERMKGEVPAETYAQLEEAYASIEEKVTDARNDPEALAKASLEGLRELESIQGTGDALAEFKKGLREGFAEATN